MRLLIITCGTEGDTRPLAALGHALMRGGHDVHLLADAATLGTAQALGVPCTALAGDIRATIAAEGAMRRITSNLARLTIAHTQDWLQQAIAAGRGCDAVVVSGLAAFVGQAAADALQVPAIGAMLIPITPTAAFASPFVPGPAPRAFNRASHWLFGHASWRLFRPATNRARRHVGLPPQWALRTDHPMLYGISPVLLPRPHDWPATTHLCGQWIAPAPAWTPPRELVDFLDAGEPPVYVGFGSMAGFDNARLLRAVVGAIGARRALFSAGWSGIDAHSLPANFHPVGHVPHDWLLPRCALAIHHGGSGTTHSACRAGIPSVIVPFAGDQFFWNTRLRALGVMRHTLRGSTITAARLAAAIDHAGGADARRRAAALGMRMRDGDGTAAAVALVEHYAGDR
ncbi:glycosyltransferase family 1 protein [Luteimonas yindakuii]|uniref:glycosyltransferase n=1 Tax=Luteimonas yindakuii TaxID=2565782 RepID=UPI0010A48DF1|nr:glycosyltransferase [Luteimonas yindakuii]QCO66691.1 glycosyltransferase family 1 protein [Luteimonas yindakuii]